MNENSNLKNEIENEGSLVDINNYIKNNILNFPSNSNFNNLIEISSNKSNKTINLYVIEKKIMSKFNIKYKIKYNSRKIYNDLIMYTLLFNKNTHLVSVFKDYMIFDYVDEFFKRFYTSKEASERLPQFSIFYKNYLTFFCQPCFSSFKYNNLIQRNREKKAELFYNKNFREKNKESNEDEGIIEDSEEEEDYEVGKSWIEKTIFNETIKKYIEQYSPINSSMALPESETKLKNDESGLLTSFDNQSSLRNIIKNMKKNKIINKEINSKDEEISEIKKKEKIDIIPENIEKENIHNIKNNRYYNTNKYKFNKIKYNEIGKNKDKDKKESNLNSINNSNKKLDINKDKQKEINIINLNNKKEKFNIKNSEKESQISSIGNTNNKNKKQIYIKKIEMIKINKARSNSNRNSNFKEKKKINSDININDYNKNKNIAVNHSQNIINMIKNIKNLDNNKRLKNEAQPYKKNNINTHNNNFKKNFSEKEMINNNNNHKKYISRNKKKNEDISENDKKIEINNNNSRNFNNRINNNKIQNYYGLYHRKTVSKEKKDTN